MARRPLYVPASDIGPAEYTPGKDYMLEDGKEYIGLYHVYSNGQIWSGPSFDKYSKELQEYVGTIANGTAEAGMYFTLTGTKFNKHRVPEYHYPQPIKKDYDKANFMRFFVAKKNDASTITEVNKKQYAKINISNKVGINDDIYRQVQLKWSLSGPKASVMQFNKAAILKAAKLIPTIKSYLGDLAEYYKG